MRKLVIALGLLAAIVAIALLARGRLDSGASPATTPPRAPAARAPAASTPPPDTGAADLDTAVVTPPEPLPADDTATPQRRPDTAPRTPAATPPAAERGGDDDGGHAAASDAERVLARAARAYAGVQTLTADFVQRVENPILQRTTVSRGRLAQRRPDRFLMDFSEPAGDRVVSDGSSLWVYYPSLDPGQVVRLPAARGAGSMDLQAQFLGDPQRRFEPGLRGRETVAGRPADVLVLDPREPVGYARLVVWVDREDGLARRFEITEDNGTVRRFDLAGLRTGVPLDDALFRFTPPAGVRVVERG